MTTAPRIDSTPQITTEAEQLAFWQSVWKGLGLYPVFCKDPYTIILTYDGGDQRVLADTLFRLAEKLRPYALSLYDQVGGIEAEMAKARAGDGEATRRIAVPPAGRGAPSQMRQRGPSTPLYEPEEVAEVEEVEEATQPRVTKRKVATNGRRKKAGRPRAVAAGGGVLSAPQGRAIDLPPAQRRRVPRPIDPATLRAEKPDVSPEPTDVGGDFA